MVVGIEQALLGDADDFIADVDTATKGAFKRMITQANTGKKQGGLMPVDTGFLQDSICVNGVQGKDQWVRGVDSTAVGGTLTAVWKAAYAGFVEGGTRLHPPQPFARTALGNYPSFLRDEFRRL